MKREFRAEALGNQLLLRLFDESYFVRLRTTLSVEKLKLYCCAFGKSFKSFSFNRRVVNENVFAAFLFDEAKTFAVVKPLNTTRCHVTS
jgi:hypothetical protein